MLQPARLARAQAESKQTQDAPERVASTDDRHLASALVQCLLPEGACTDPRQRAIELLRQLQAKSSTDDSDIATSRATCTQCQQMLMGQAWEVRLNCNAH